MRQRWKLRTCRCRDDWNLGCMVDYFGIGSRMIFNDHKGLLRKSMKKASQQRLTLPTMVQYSPWRLQRSLGFNRSICWTVRSMWILCCKAPWQRRMLRAFQCGFKISSCWPWSDPQIDKYGMRLSAAAKCKIKLMPVYSNIFKPIQEAATSPYGKGSIWNDSRRKGSLVTSMTWQTCCMSLGLDVRELWMAWSFVAWSKAVLFVMYFYLQYSTILYLDFIEYSYIYDIAVWYESSFQYVWYTFCAFICNGSYPKSHWVPSNAICFGRIMFHCLDAFVSWFMLPFSAVNLCRCNS